MKLAGLSISHPRVVLVTVFTVTVWGLVALVTIPRREDPAIAWRLANVVTRLPGTSAQRMEALVTDVLERHIEQVDEVEHVYSVSRPGVSLIQIELIDDVTDVDPVWHKVRDKLRQAQAELPPGVSGPDLDDQIMGTSTLLIAFASKSATYRQLKDHAQRLEERIRYLPGTASTALYGVQREVIHVEVDPAKLALHDLTIQQVAHAIRNRNTREPSGRLQAAGRELVIETAGEFDDEFQLSDMVLTATPAGRMVHLSDVARIDRTTVNPPDPLARFNGVPAVFLSVRAHRNTRIDVYSADIKAMIERYRGERGAGSGERGARSREHGAGSGEHGAGSGEREAGSRERGAGSRERGAGSREREAGNTERGAGSAELPLDIECAIAHEEAAYTEQSMKALLGTMLLSIVLVFVSIPIFMGWTAALVVTVAIPFTALLVLVAFDLAKIPLHQMSVMGMIMAFGLLVDAAVIVTEHMRRRIQAGGERKTAVIDAASELALPIAMSTLTTVAAFVPIYLLPGGVGEFVRAIPISIAFSLLGSYVVAIFFCPWLYFHLVSARGSTDREARFAPFAAARRRIGQLYVRTLEIAVQRPWTTVALVAMLMLGLGALGLTLRRDFFSPVQRDQFVVDIYGPQGSALTDTLRTVREAESVIGEQAETVSVCSFVGRNGPLIFYNLVSQETYADLYAQLIVRTSDWRTTAAVAQRVQAQLNARIAGADACVHILEHGAPFIAPFEVRIRGPSIQTLREIARRAASVLEQTPGVRNVRDNYGQEAMRLVVDVNEPAARRTGVPEQLVADQLRSRLDGFAAGLLVEDDEQIDIVVRLPSSNRRSISDLQLVYFKPEVGQPAIPFASVARIQPEWETASVYRRDGQRTVSVLAYPEFGSTAAQISQQFAPRLASLARTLPANYGLELGGENEQRHEAESNLLATAVYALLLILLFVVIEFRTLRLTGIILLMVPLSVSGAMAGLWLTGWPLNFMAIMGTVMLMGVAVNDAIVLVDGFERRRQQRQPMQTLVVEGTVERTNDIVVTSVTTIAGFLPVAFSQSLLWPPLAIAMIGGLTVETFITLIGIPAAYSLVCGKYGTFGDGPEAAAEATARGAGMEGNGPDVGAKENGRSAGTEGNGPDAGAGGNGPDVGAGGNGPR